MQPIYSQINGLDFFLFYIPLLIIVGVYLNYFNNSYLKKIVGNWSSDAFVNNLSVSEVIYLKKHNKNDVIHNEINKLIRDNYLYTNSINKNTSKKDIYEIKICNKTNPKSVEEFVIIDSVSTISSTSEQVLYPSLLKALTNKEVFRNTYQAMDKFVETIKSSAPFTKLFLIKNVVISTLTIIG